MKTQVGFGANRLKVIGCASALMIALGGCSPSASDEDYSYPDLSKPSDALSYAKEHNLSWEMGVLEDGVVTAAEYEDSYDRYMECLSTLGYVPDVEKYLDPVSSLQWRSLMKYDGTDDNIAKVSNDTCGMPLYAVEDPYVTGGTPRMEASLLAGFKECLDKNNIKYVGTEITFDEFAKAPFDQSESTESLAGCLAQSVEATHPEAIGYSL